MEKKLEDQRKNPSPLSPDVEFWSMQPGLSDPFNQNERKADLKTEVARLRKETKELDRVIKPLETEVKCYQHFCDREIYNLKKLITKIERIPLDAKRMLENAVKTKQDRSVALEKLLRETMILKSEFEKVEDVLNRRKSYKTILLKLAPPEWQEAKEAEHLKAKDALKEHNSEPEETADKKCEEAALKSSLKGTLPLESKLSEEENQLTNSSVLSGIGKQEKTADIYFSDPIDVVILMSELTDQVLFLIENTTEMDKKAGTDLGDHPEYNDLMLEALGRKVTEVHSRCLKSRPINLATLEKLCSIEYHMVGLLQDIQNLPRDLSLKLWRVKESERKARLRDQRLLQEREKLKEKMNECMKRANREIKKYTGRKLMQRCIPVQKKAEVVADPSAPVEEDPYAELMIEGWE